VPEYDSLADLYDLEYRHDFDLPFWLALAEREAGPVVEWGAGTGRLAVPLAAAGHNVTAVDSLGRWSGEARERVAPLRGSSATCAAHNWSAAMA
jgi:2-polyprenyl-3-methyl-5-hydroxy-6-metoxy-1,4-benzoquinol methylase